MVRAFHYDNVFIDLWDITSSFLNILAVIAIQAVMAIQNNGDKKILQLQQSFRLQILDIFETTIKIKNCPISNIFIFYRDCDILEKWS